MCGRFASTSTSDQLASYFDALAPESLEDERADYNVAPTRDVPVVRVRSEDRCLDYLRWGLVPKWAKDLRIGSKMINARAETVATKNAFRSAFQRRRCIVVADGFYEWKRTPVEGSSKPHKQPMFIHRADGDPLAFAGLYERWTDAEDLREIHTCTIITTTPNEMMAEIHNRMPVLLPPSVWDSWLDPDHRDVADLERLLVPAPDSLLAAYPVSDSVNSVKNNDASLIEPQPVES